MGKSILNVEIERIFNEIDNADLNNNFLGVFPSNKINKFISLKKMMVDRKNPFLIANTDRTDKGGTNWWSILDISQASDILLMDSFGVFGLKNFIVQNNTKIVERIIKGIEKLD